MTALSLHLPSGRDYRAGSFRRLALNLINGFREALVTLDRYEHLARKSDSELAALKLHREDLPAIAMNGRH